MTPLSGERVRLTAAGYEAEVAGVGASLRMLRHEGRDLVASFAADALRPALRGALLVPWPNRVADGSYEFDGERHQLVVDEPATRTATHGLVAWQEFRVVSQSSDRVALRAGVSPRPGYPWRLRVDVEFALDEHGLSQEVAVANESGRIAPVGIGGHPYLVAGPVRERAVDEWMLTVAASEVLLISDDRMLPVASVPAHDGGRFDFGRPRTMDGTALNNAFTGLIRTGDGMAAARVVNPTGQGAELTWDDRCPWVQVYTADEPVDGMSRCAVAVEPMTCPPDAFNSGRDLHAVAPGDVATAGWRIRALAG